MTGTRFPVSGVSDEQLAALEDQVEASDASSRAKYIRQIITALDDERLRAVDENPVDAIQRLLDDVAPPVDAASYDPAEGVSGTLDRETVYDILEHYDAPAIRAADVEESSLPGKVNGRTEALAAVVRWEYDDPSDYSGAAKSAIRSAIRHPSDHTLDKYPSMVAKELQQTGTVPDNTLSTLPDVDVWVARSEAVERFLEQFAGGESVGEGDKSWDEYESRAEDAIDKGQRLFENVLDAGDEEQIRERLDVLEDALRRARNRQSREEVKSEMEMLDSAE